MSNFSFLRNIPRSTVIVVTGPTASGKSRFALQGAMKDGGCIINADSMQIYKGLPILTAMPSMADRDRVPHVLYEILPAYVNHFSVAQWVEYANKAIRLALNKGQRAWVVGGTGFYLQALIEGISMMPEVDPLLKEHWRHCFADMSVAQLQALLRPRDPILADKLCDTQRLIHALTVEKTTGNTLSFWQSQGKKKSPFSFYGLLIDVELNAVVDASMKRWWSMVDQGVYQEVRSFCSHEDWKISRLKGALGMKDIKDFLDGKISESECCAQYQKNVRAYIKRQKTWFRSKFYPDQVIHKKT